MLVCTGLCEYYQTYDSFAPNRTYENYKQCTRCGHIVEKEEFPDFKCYCCNAKYRHRYRSSMITRKAARQRKRDRQRINLKSLNVSNFIIRSMVEIRSCDYCGILFPMTEDLKHDENLCIKHRHIKNNNNNDK